MVNVESKRIRVEVAYALPQEQVILPLEVEAGTSLEQAVRESGILEQFPEINLDTAKMGIFGKVSKADTTLRDKDRVEIYRPLIADPKAVRKQRAAEGKRMRKGGGDMDSEQDEDKASATGN